jgi:hypothetical protein
LRAIRRLLKGLPSLVVTCGAEGPAISLPLMGLTTVIRERR